MVVAANVTPEVTADSLPSLNAEQLRALASDLIAQIGLAPFARTHLSFLGSAVLFA